MSLIRAEYEYLKGNKDYWAAWGAAMSVVMDYCKRHGYGDFGKPTPSGEKMIEIFERDHPHGSED